MHVHNFIYVVGALTHARAHTRPRLARAWSLHATSPRSVITPVASTTVVKCVWGGGGGGGGGGDGPQFRRL